MSLGTPEEHSRTAQRDKALATLPTEQPGFTVAEVAKQSGLTARAVRTALEDAYAAKIADRAGAGKKGDPFRYVRLVVFQQRSTTTVEPVAVGADDRELAEV